MSKTKDPFKNMDLTYDYYYKFLKKILSLTGQWPYQTQRSKRLFFSITNLCILSITVTQVPHYIKCNGNMPCIFQTLSASILIILTLTKLYTCAFNQSKIKLLFDQLFNEWKKLNAPEEYQIMKNYAKNGSRLALGYSMYCVLSAFGFLCVSLIPHAMDIILPLNESRPVFPPSPSYYFVDEREYFIYIYLHSVVAWEFVMFAANSHDCLLLTYVEYACSVFTIIGFRFEQLMNKNIIDPGETLHPYSDTNCKEIRLSVCSHQQILKFTDTIEEMFSWSLAVQLALGTIIISITLLQITQEDADFLVLVRYVVYVAAQLIHIFCLSFVGQKLVDHSTQTREKIYNSIWYQTPPKLQKMLLFVLLKTLQPIFLTAGKIYIFSMEGFTTILQTALSYFTVLATVE